MSKSSERNECLLISYCFVAIVVARAFITSQSAAAHLLLFRTIYHIAQMDSGKPFRLQYAHGEGLGSITADEHRGQAVGEYMRVNGSKSLY